MLGAVGLCVAWHRSATPVAGRIEQNKDGCRRAVVIIRSLVPPFPGIGKGEWGMMDRDGSSGK